MIIKMTSSKSKIIYLPLPQDDPRQRQPDISLAKKELGWSPVVEWRQDWQRQLSTFRKVLNDVKIGGRGDGEKRRNFPYSPYLPLCFFHLNIKSIITGAYFHDIFDT